jgi:quinol monooxygenase YgiN
MIQVIVFYKLKEESIDSFTRAFKIARANVLLENGCLQYEIFVSPYTPTRFCLVEKWASDEAISVHLKTKHLADFQVLTQTWFEEKPVIEIKNIENERQL